MGVIDNRKVTRLNRTGNTVKTETELLNKPKEPVKKKAKKASKKK